MSVAKTQQQKPYRHAVSNAFEVAKRTAQLPMADDGGAQPQLTVYFDDDWPSMPARS
jgi:hypothetical protein